MPDPINPDEIPADLLKPEEVESTARRIKQLGRATADQGAALQRTWHGLAHHYEAPESHALLTIMDPVKTNTHGFSENTTTVAKALTAYAIEEERVKLELDRIKKQAETFVAAVAGGVTRRHEVPKGGPVSEKVPWHEDQGSIDTNNALLAQIDAQLTALREAQERCANTVYDIIGFPHPGNPVGAGGPRPAAPGPSVQAMPWGAPTQRTERCGEQVATNVKWFVVDGVFLGAVVGGAKQLAATSAMGALGRNPETGAWFDYANTLPMVVQLNEQLLKFGVGTALATPGFPMLAAGKVLPGPVGRYLQQSLDVLVETGKGLLAWDKYRENKAAALGEAFGNVALLFIPVAGEAIGPVKVGAEASRGATALRGAAKAAEFVDPLSLTAKGVAQLAKFPRLADVAAAINRSRPGLEAGSGKFPFHPLAGSLAERDLIKVTIPAPTREPAVVTIVRWGDHNEIVRHLDSPGPAAPKEPVAVGGGAHRHTEQEVTASHDHHPVPTKTAYERPAAHYPAVEGAGGSVGGESSGGGGRPGGQASAAVHGKTSGPPMQPGQDPPRSHDHLPGPEDVPSGSDAAHEPFNSTDPSDDASSEDRTHDGTTLDPGGSTSVDGVELQPTPLQDCLDHGIKSGHVEPSFSAELERSDPAQRARLFDLARDPAHGRITTGSQREAVVGLRLEKLEGLQAPIKRSSDPWAEFIEPSGRLWDVKSFQSSVSRRGVFVLQDSIDNIARKISRQVDVIVDAGGMSRVDLQVLAEEVHRTPSLQGHVRIFDEHHHLGRGVWYDI